jgi:hypothetical protein
MPGNIASAQVFQGEGYGTEIDLTPSSSAIGIRLVGWYNGLNNMRIKATNANVTDLVQIPGGSTGANTQFGQYHHLRIEGPSARPTGPVGIHLLAGSTGGANYSNEMSHIFFVNLDYGIKLDNGTIDANANYIDRISVWFSNYGVYCDGSMNFISNVLLQGTNSTPESIAAVQLGPNATSNSLWGIISEHNTTINANSATVVMENGGNNNVVYGIRNTVGPTRILDLDTGGGKNRAIGNPQAVQNISLGASPATITNTYGGMADIYLGNDNGPVTKIEYGHQGTFTDLKVTYGSFLLDTGEQLKVTYSGIAPQVKVVVH